MAYVTLEELRAQVQLGDDQSHDGRLQIALDAAEGAIDSYCHRSFSTVNPDLDLATSRVYTARSRSRVIIHDLAALDQVAGRAASTEPYETVEADAVGLWPAHAAVEGRPYTELRRVSGVWLGGHAAVRVTGWFGWLAVPAVVKQATLLQASRFFQRRSAQFGVAPVPGLEGGGGMRLLAKLDADVELMLNTVRRDPTRTPA